MTTNKINVCPLDFSFDNLFGRHERSLKLNLFLEWLPNYSPELVVRLYMVIICSISDFFVFAYSSSKKFNNLFHIRMGTNSSRVLFLMHNDVKHKRIQNSFEIQNK